MILGECRAFVGRAQLHVISMFLRMRNATGRSVDDIHTNRVDIDLANTWLAALAPMIMNSDMNFHNDKL